jgi:hypothetical protein
VAGRLIKWVLLVMVFTVRVMVVGRGAIAVSVVLHRRKALIDFIAEVKDDRILKAAAAAAHKQTKSWSASM